MSRKAKMNRTLKMKCIVKQAGMKTGRSPRSDTEQRAKCPKLGAASYPQSCEGVWADRAVAASSWKALVFCHK